MNWATTIRQLRRSLHLDQVSFGHDLGVSQSAISKWERGVDIPNRQARNKVIDMTRSSKRAFEDVSVILRTRFDPFPVLLLDRKAKVVEMSDACAMELGRPRCDLMARDSMLGAFGKSADEAIESLVRSGLFNGGVIGANYETIFNRPDHHKGDTRGMSFWIYPIFLNDGEILANCCHKTLPADQIKSPGSFKALNIDQVCI